MGRVLERLLFLEWLNFLIFLCFIAVQGGGRLASAEGLDTCCENISTDAICHNACMETLESSTNSGTFSSIQIQALSSACLPSYTTFWSCLNQSVTSVEVTVDPPTLTTPGYYFCCNSSESDRCRSACQEFLVTENWEVTDLSQYCDLAPLDPVWSCILAYSEPTDPPTTSANDSIPIQPPYADWARVQCCYQAIDDRCRDSCLDLYTGLVNSQSWYIFQLDCIHRPSENALSTCLADVTSPCKLGCSGLNFCENFNNRPTETFRQCNSAADRMAKNTYYIWANSGVISHPLITIFVNNIDQCLANMWKTVACITHVQPCHYATHATQICRKDCIQLLTKCSNSSIAPTAICDIIAPASTEKHCLSVSQFIEPSTYVTSGSSPISNPCDSSPCAEGYFCAINHECQSDRHACTPYSCQPGCVVGDKPSFVLPEGSGVRVSLVTETGRGNCFGYFNCSSDFGTTQATTTEINALGGTRVLPSYMSRRPVYSYCERASRCHVDETITLEHKKSITLGCNFCTCFYGRLICTQRKCQLDENGNLSTFANCGCPMNRMPVCTRDGRTLPNSCFASCLGYGALDYVVGDCGSVDGCLRSSCESDSRCIPQRRVCLSVNNSDHVCKQYTCVSVDQAECSGVDLGGPVCDTSNSQHTNLCAFLRTQKEFDYFGYCKSTCSSSKMVCGVDGKTYNTPCHASDSHVAVDYYGPCSTVPGRANLKGDLSGCDAVICPSLSHPGCTAVLPWDSCCPKCGAHVTLLYDQELLGRNIHSLGKEFISSTDIVRRLRYHISSLQCDLFGHLSMDGSLSVLVLATGNSSNPNVVEACNQEAVKLATFINNHTPMLASDPYLSHLVAAKVETGNVGDGFLRDRTTDNFQSFSGAGQNTCVLPLLFLLSVLVMLVYIQMTL